jgi:hypothetical protein
MKFLAGYVMRGPMQAILVTTLGAMLSLILPPLSYLSGATVGLVTLRLGAWRGLTVAGGAALAAGLLSLLTVRTALPGGAYFVVVWLPVIVLAVHLKRTVSLARTLGLAAVFGGAMIAALHVGVADPAAFWQKVFEDLLKQAGRGPEPAAEMQEAFRLMTGAMAAALTLSLVASLFIARWWQAQLYNPGGFQSEFHALRFSRVLGVVTLVTAAGALAGGSVTALAGDLLLVWLVLHLLHGLAVAHGLVKKGGANALWLFGMYALMLWPPFLPPTVITLAALGFADEWFDFRSFFGKKEEV